MSHAATCCEEFKVTRRTMSVVENNEAVVKSRDNERESSYAATDLELAEAFGAGSEYFPLWRVSLFPSTSSRLFRQEEE
jgi:hypothetical protein